MFYDENLTSEPCFVFFSSSVIFCLIDCCVHSHTFVLFCFLSRNCCEPPTPPFIGREREFVGCHPTLWRQIVVNISGPIVLPDSSVDMFLCAECSSGSVRLRDFPQLLFFSSRSVSPLRKNARKKRYGSVHRKFLSSESEEPFLLASRDININIHVRIPDNFFPCFSVLT